MNFRLWVVAVTLAVTGAACSGDACDQLANQCTKCSATVDLKMQCDQEAASDSPASCQDALDAGTYSSCQ